MRQWMRVRWVEGRHGFGRQVADAEVAAAIGGFAMAQVQLWGSVGNRTGPSSTDAGRPSKRWRP